MKATQSRGQSVIPAGHKLDGKPPCDRCVHWAPRPTSVEWAQGSAQPVCTHPSTRMTSTHGWVTIIARDWCRGAGFRMQHGPRNGG